MNTTLTLVDLGGAIALLIWGVHMVQTGITRAFGPQLRRMLSYALGTRFKAFLAGLGVTSILQSSTATGLMVTAFAAGELVDLVRRGELDVALVDGPVTDRTLTSAPVTEDHMVIVLPADHMLARPEAVSIPSLKGEQFVSVARRSSVTLHDRFIELCGAAGFSPEVALEVDDPDLLPLAVAAGLGVGLAATAQVAGRLMPGVVSRPLDDARAAIPLVAVGALHGASAQAQEFLHLVHNLHHGGRLLHSATIDLTDRPEDVVATPSRVLQPAV